MKNKQRPEQVTNYLERNTSQLHTILMKAKRLQQLQSLLSLWIRDEPMLSACTIANIENGRLILFAANASIATQLRFRAPELKELFCRHEILKDLCEIEFKVRPKSRIALEKPLPQPYLSTESAAHLKEAASWLEDENIQKCLIKLAKNINQPR